jgi:RNA polymerase sigma factor (sigma-70 family)
VSPPLESSHRSLLREDAALRRWVRSFAPPRVDPADVTQDAWLAALERDLGADGEPLGGWLRVAARRIALRRGWREGRRATVESSVARSESRDPAGDLEPGREAAERMLERLDEPYRSVLRARFLEDLSIDEIARRRGCPAATVRSHLHRGLRRLRALLGPEERRERRLGLLAALRRRPRLALSGAVLLGTALVVVQLGQGSAVRDTDAQAAIGGTEVPRRSMTTPGAGGARAPLSSGDPAPSVPGGPRLAVHVLDADGGPADGATLLVFTPAGLEPRALCDAEGRAEVALRPTDRGAHGLPATADRVTVRARRAGSADSSDLHVDPDAAGPLELALGGPSLTLGGRVQDTGGTPVRGALVAFLQGPAFVAPSTTAPFATPARATTETDADGSFTLHGLARGPGLVRVWAPALAEHRESIAPGNAAHLDLELVLARGATVQGTLRDRDGRPLAGAEVFAEPHERLGLWSLDPRHLDLERLDLLHATRSAADGTFRLSGLEPGLRTIWARRGDDSARQRVPLDDGQVCVWNGAWLPREGLSLRIRGAPPDVLVRLSSGPPQAQWLRRVSPDAEGRVRVTDLPDGPLFAEVLDRRGVELLARAGPLAPGPELHELSVGSDPAAHGRVRGVLLDARGRPLGDVELKRYDPWSHGQVAIAVDPSSGVFEARFPPGTFVLGCVVARRGLPLGTFELAPAQTLDLGRLLLPATGRLVPLLDAGPPIEGTPASYRLSARYGQALFRELQRGPWPPPESFELFPGPHWMEVMDAEGTVLLRASAQVHEGQESWIDLW